MSVFIIALSIGLCLCFAGLITVLRAVFARVSDTDLIESPSSEYAVYHLMLLQQDRIFSALVFAYLFFIISAVLLTTHYLLPSLNYWQIALHCVLVPVFIIIVTDTIPRAYALQLPMQDSIAMLPWVKRVAAIFAFPAYLTTSITKIFKGTMCPLDNLFNTSEFYPLVTRYYQAQEVSATPEKKHHLMQQSLARLGNMTVSELMIPVRKLKLMDAALEVDELLNQSFETNARRILLYQDQPEDIIGILHVSLLMKSFCLAEGDKDTTDITSAISEPVFISPDKLVLEQLQDFSSKQTQFALIRDSNEFIKGAIDLEAILDALASGLKQKTV